MLYNQTLYFIFKKYHAKNPHIFYMLKNEKKEQNSFDL